MKTLRVVSDDDTTVTLLDGVSLRDAELVRNELAVYGFVDSTPAPEVTPQVEWETTSR